MFSYTNNSKLNKRGKMKKLIKTSFSLFAIFAIVITFSLQQVNAAEKIRWKVQSTFNTGWPALGDPVARLSASLLVARAIFVPHSSSGSTFLQHFLSAWQLQLKEA
jgi:hypothetical protein